MSEKMTDEKMSRICRLIYFSELGRCTCGGRGGCFKSCQSHKARELFKKIEEVIIKP